MADNDTTWPVPTIKASESKECWKSGASNSPIWELVGIDGTNQGAMVLNSGFREAWVFGPENLAGTDFPNNSNVNPYATNTNLMDVVDFWPFSMRIGSSNWAYGIVYIATRPSSSTRDLIMEGYRTDTGVKFYKVVTEGSAGNALLGTNYAVDVTCTPRVVYVAVSGQAPKAICFSGSTLKLTTAGPGAKPTQTWSETAINGGAAFTPTTAQLPDPATVGNPPGSFVIYSTQAVTGTWTAPTNWAPNSTDWNASEKFKAGNYSFAVQFEDSTTGRRSQLSNSASVTWTGADRRLSIVGILDTDKYDTVKIWRSVRSANAAGVFTAGILQLEATFKATDKAITPATNPVWSPALGASVIKWAYAVTNSDRVLVMQDVFLDGTSFLSDVPWGGAIATLDNQLVISKIKSQDADTQDQMKSVGEIRWSSATDGSYELFATRGRWTPEAFGDTPIAYCRAGQALVGLSQSRAYFIVRDGAYVRVTPAHSGFGIVNPAACSSIGPMVYYVTKQGVKSVYADGRLDEVQALDWLVSVDWANDLGSVSLATSPSTTCIYLLNPNKGKIAILWFSSGTVSEIHDVGFKKCASGWWPNDADTYSSELQERALFLLSPSDLVHTAKTTGYRPRLMVPAVSGIDRKQTPTDTTNNAYHYGTIDGPGERRTTCTATANASNYDLSYTPPATPWTPTWRTLGMYGRVLSSTRSSSDIGNTFKVVGITASDTPTVKPILGTLPTSGETFRFILNSMVVRAETAPLPGGTGIPGNTAAGGFMMVKQVTGVTVIFRGVQLSPGVVSDGDGKWRALAYKGDSGTATASGFSNKPDGTATTSIAEGVTPIAAAFGTHGIMDPNPSAGIEIYAVCMDFRIVAFAVKGRILGTERTSRNYA